jgi:hypothetical protein
VQAVNCRFSLKPESAGHSYNYAMARRISDDRRLPAPAPEPDADMKSEDKQQEH